MTHFAPIGKPQSIPSNTAEQPSPERRKILHSGLQRREINARPTPPDTISSDNTIKGKSDGMTVFAQSRRPRFIYSIAMLVFRRIKKRQKMPKSPKQICPEVRSSRRIFVFLSCEFVVM